MKKMFLASSFCDVAYLFSDFAKVDLEGKVVTFIATASKVEEYTAHVDNDRKAFRDLGIEIEELDVSTADIETIKKVIAFNHFIFISGGNAFYLLQELRKSGADNVIIEQVLNGKIYIGTSAGSVIMAPDITYLKMMDDVSKAPDLSVYIGFDLINFYPLVHYDSEPFVEVADEIFNTYAGELDLIPITNGQAILVKGDEVELAGEDE
ncbi:Type 1 glutamine amidotransferase-like domain-containing protein [Myroides injenensis]|uniref:Type 1 glutamine amidotransferase-like domain-containing protein n=1 Tax=Myroides injenensis TaxID=1183151 RepID=UPI000288B2ED|nr:Type 1 glutamine amidotransferase-like domain-containing protein [Myroides injenensis]